MNMNFSTSINKYYFGSGSLAQLGNQELPGKKALLLISMEKSTKANGYLDKND